MAQCNDLTKARCRPRNAKDPEGAMENSMHAEEKGRIFPASN